jgi:hemerythrin-like metal-binding protein
MPEFAWKKELSVANATLDTQHQKLIDLINQVEDALRTRNQTLLPSVFEQMTDAVAVHFHTEEQIACAINLLFDDHKLLHDYVNGELLIMAQDVANLAAHWSESRAECCSYFLSEWFYEHLTEDVTLLKPVLKSYPYNYEICSTPSISS